MAHYWRSFGATIVGPSHIASQKPNQDSWSSFHHSWGDGIVLSDGLGSKSLSDWGSRYACKAVESAAQNLRLNKSSPLEMNSLLIDIQKTWLKLIGDLPEKECSATCLFALRFVDGNIYLGMLGDGCASVVTNKNQVKKIEDDKNNSFSNMTNALSSNLSPDSWLTMSIRESECNAIILCSDGISDDLDDTDGFILKFYESNCNKSTILAEKDSYNMLNSWPVPKHSDDKTIACLIKEAINDES
jgi:serine/threonine protein phosphatase PrpC